MKAHTLGGWVEVQYMHVDLGFRCPCVKKGKRSPLRFYLPTWFTVPVTYNEKGKWVSMMKYIISTHLMDQNNQRWNTENISKRLFMYLCQIYNIAIMNINACSWNYIAFYHVETVCPYCFMNKWTLVWYSTNSAMPILDNDELRAKCQTFQ